MDKVTKIGELIARLQECDPEGSLSISLDAALLEDCKPGEVEYSFQPMVAFLFSQANGERSEQVYFSLAHEDVEKLIAIRRDEELVDLPRAIPTSSNSPDVVHNAPVAVAIALSENAYADLQAVVASCNCAHDINDGMTTHGRLDVPNLIGMLAEDAAMTNSRPGSWEGANMQQVLDSHGYRPF